MIAASITKALGGRWYSTFGLMQCVTHNDGMTPSLKVSDNPRRAGGIDVHCFAGCDFRNVRDEFRRRGRAGFKGQGRGDAR